MSKPAKSSSKGNKPMAKAPEFKDHDLKNVNPTKEQFEPTDTSAIRQRARMGGAG